MEWYWIVLLVIVGMVYAAVAVWVFLEAMFASSVQSAFGWGGESLLSCAITGLLWPLLIPAAIIFSLVDYWRDR